MPVSALHGTVLLPPDKSIAHRAMLLAAIGEGTSTVVGFPEAADPRSTKACMEALGARVTEDDGVLSVEGHGTRGLRAPSAPLDCGNSGTTMRLLAGLLAGQSFESVLVGDASLSGRPMRRVADPLAAMGARIATTDGHAPLHVTGAPLTGMVYRLTVASAQVKSCVLLAGMLAEGTTTVVEPVATRDHTERMLGLEAVVDGVERRISVDGGHRVAAQTWTVPRDFSAAAFFLVAGSIVPEGDLVLPGVGLNPTRTALLDVLRRMGADIVASNARTVGGEPIADLVVRPARLRGVRVDGAVVANLIDEVPILALAAACADGVTEIRDASELRVKETDRIAAVAQNLRALGADVTEHPDGLTVRGGRRLTGAHLATHGDHRIAMMAGIAGLVAHGAVTTDDPGCAAVSFPGFWETLAGVVRG